MKLKVGDPVRMIARTSSFQNAIEVRMTIKEIKGKNAVCEWEEEILHPDEKMNTEGRKYYIRYSKEFPLNKLIPVGDYGKSE